MLPNFNVLHEFVSDLNYKFSILNKQVFNSGLFHNSSNSKLNYISDYVLNNLYGKLSFFAGEYDCIVGVKINMDKKLLENLEVEERKKIISTFTPESLNELLSFNYFPLVNPSEKEVNSNLLKSLLPFHKLYNEIFRIGEKVIEGIIFLK
jgi:hypothetical protein